MWQTEYENRVGRIRSFLALAVLIVLVVSLLLASGRGVVESFDSWEVRAQFGDMFGFANALFSGLAFAGVVWAILLQRKDLQLQSRSMELQRQELELTRDELQRSADAHEETLRHLEQENVQKALERRRSVTPIFHWSGSQVPTKPSNKVDAKEYVVTNIGSSVFRPEVYMTSDLPVFVSIDEVAIVHNDAKLQFRAESAIPGKSLKDIGVFDFLLFCYDIHGNKRRQVFRCDPSSFKGIVCVDPDIGIPQTTIPKRETSTVE